MQTQLAGPALRGSARNASPYNEDYVRGLSSCVLEALALCEHPAVQQAVCTIERDLTRGRANAYSWLALHRAARDAGLRASLLSVINAVVLEINAARMA